MLKVKLLDPRAKAPTVNNPGEDIAYDLYALEDVELKPGTVTKVRTGIAVEARILDRAFACSRPAGLLIRDRSSMASQGVTVSGGVIDAGYRGEVIVLIQVLRDKYVVTSGYKHEVRTTVAHRILAGDKIAQMIPMPVLTGDVETVDELSGAARGEKGFGSSGR